MTDAPRPDDMPSEDASSAEAAVDETALDDLERQAARTEREAIDAGILPDPDEKEFHESGSIRPDLDDQTIAPPG
jgi:hypothetical protein